MPLDKTKICILDTPSLVRRTLQSQLIMNGPDNVVVEVYDSIEAIEPALDHTVKAIFVDAFRFPMEEITGFIGGVRNACPWIVFILWVNSNEYRQKRSDLPAEWSSRFEHYFKLDKQYSSSERFGSDVVTALHLVDKDYWRYINNPLIRMLIEEGNPIVGSPGPAQPEHSVIKASVEPSEQRVFISYARADSDFVDWLWQQLEGQSIATWVDRKNIQPGDVWDDKINDALKQCAALVLVLSPESVESANVSKEWKYAMMTLSRPIIPVLWKDCKPHFQLVHLQHVDFRNYRSGAVGELVSGLQTILGKTTN